MTTDTPSLRSEKPTPKSSEAFQTREAKPSHNASTGSLRQSGGTNVLGPVPRETAVEAFPPCSLDAGGTPSRSTNQDLPSTARKPAPAGATVAEHRIHGRTRQESQWDEGTVYGRLASLNCQPTDRNAVYCDRAAQAISDFEKKFRGAEPSQSITRLRLPCRMSRFGWRADFCFCP